MTLKSFLAASSSSLFKWKLANYKNASKFNGSYLKALFIASTQAYSDSLN